MSKKHTFYILCFIFLFSSHIYCQDYTHYDSVRNNLAKAGFENINTVSDSLSLTFTFENRHYRSHIEAMNKAIQLIEKQNIDREIINLLLLKHQFPVIETELRKNKHSDSLNYSFSKSFSTVNYKTLAFLKKSKMTQKSAYTIDCIVHPHFAARFGNYDDPFELQLNLIPEIRLNLWRGMSFSSMFVVPLYNELEKEDDKFRPYILKLSQIIPLPYKSYLSGTIGYFTKDRYGIDFEFRKYLFNDRLYLDLNVGYTGPSLHNTWDFEYNPPDLLTSRISASYWITKYNMETRATYGGFLYDTGWRFDVKRHFGEIAIGFFALLTETGNNGGFFISLPLPPKRYFKPGFIRIRPARYYSLEYRAKWIPAGGVEYSTNAGIDKYFNRLHPSYFFRQLSY